MDSQYQPGQMPEYPNVPPIHPFPVSQASNGHAPEPKPVYTRDQVRKMRLLENAGVPFWLHRTGMEATVKAFSFSDKIMLMGIPPDLQHEIEGAMNDGQTRSGQKNRSYKDILAGIANDDRLANAMCIAGFLSPRLVATEAELDGSDDCWVVTDLHPEERRKYLSLVQGGASEEDMGRIARFLRAGVATAATG